MPRRKPTLALEEDCEAPPEFGSQRHASWTTDVSGAMCHEESGTRISPTSGLSSGGLHYGLAVDDVEISTVLLGTGNSGVVRRGTIRATGVAVAVKSVRVDMPEARQELLREVQTLAQAEACPYLVHMHAAFISKSDAAVQLVLELMDLGSLAGLLKSLEPSAVPPRHLASVTLQVSRGLAHLHLHGFLHRDIKPANVLLKRSGEVKLTDFGITACLDESGNASTHTTTVTYMAPERFSGSACSLPSDIWSLGVTVYELATGRQPFESVRGAFELYSLLTEEQEPRLCESDGHPRSLCDFVAACLVRDTSGRAPVEELVAHAYLGDALPPPELGVWMESVLSGGGGGAPSISASVGTASELPKIPLAAPQLEPGAGLPSDDPATRRRAAAAIFALESEAPSELVVRGLADEDEAVRQMLASALVNLPAAALSGHVSALVRHVDQKDWSVRWAVAAALQRLEATALEPHVGLLVPCLNHEDAGVRGTVALLLGKIDAAAFADHFEVVLKHLGHRDFDVRRFASGVLSSSSPAVLSKYVSLLIPWLERKEVCARTVVTAALCRLDPEAILSHVDVLVRHLQHELEASRKAVLLVLGKVSAPDLANHADALAQCLQSSDPRVRDFVMAALEVIDTEVLGTVIPTVLRGRYTEIHLRRRVAKLLGRVDALVLISQAGPVHRLLEDDDDDIASAATVAVSELEVTSMAPFAGAILQQLNHKHAVVRRAATHAFSKLVLPAPGDPPAALSSRARALVRRLDDEDATVRRTAARALEGADAAALQPHADGLAKATVHSDATVRRLALSALSRLGPLFTRHAAVAIARLEDEDRAVRLLAAASLGRLEPPTLVAHIGALLMALEHSDAPLRLAALAALGSLDPMAFKPHTGALLEKLGGLTPDVQWWVLGTLVSGDASLSASSSLQFLDHDNACVRWASLSALRRAEPKELAAQAEALAESLGRLTPSMRQLVAASLSSLEPKDLAQISEQLASFTDDKGPVMRHLVAAALRSGDTQASGSLLVR